MVIAASRYVAASTSNTGLVKSSFSSSAPTRGFCISPLVWSLSNAFLMLWSSLVFLLPLKPRRRLLCCSLDSISAGVWNRSGCVFLSARAKHQIFLRRAYQAMNTITDTANTINIAPRTTGTTITISSLLMSDIMWPRPLLDHPLNYRTSWRAVRQNCFYYFTQQNPYIFSRVVVRSQCSTCAHF